MTIQQPFAIFTDTDGSPLESGKIYIGTYGLNPETNPITVYWDANETQPAAQPIRTVSGVPARNGAPAALFGSGQYSMTVRNRNDEIVSTNTLINNLQDYGTY